MLNNRHAVLSRIGYIHISAWRLCPISVIGVSARFHIGAKLMPTEISNLSKERNWVICLAAIWSYKWYIYIYIYIMASRKYLFTQKISTSYSEALKQHNLLSNKLDIRSIRASTPLQKLYDPGCIRLVQAENFFGAQYQ